MSNIQYVKAYLKFVSTGIMVYAVAVVACVVQVVISDSRKEQVLREEEE